MKSDSDGMEEEEEGEEEEEKEEKKEEGEVAKAGPSSFPVVLPGQTAQDGTGVQMVRSESPETLYTMTTQQQPPGAMVIETRSSDLEDLSENDEEDMDEVLVTHSPEPPEPVEPDDAMQTDEDSQPGRLHPEQDMPHIFRKIQIILSRLTREELHKFKIWFYQWEQDITLKQVMEGDLLDFVDRIMEVLGHDRALIHTLSSLDAIHKKEEAEELRNMCKRALVHYHLRQHMIRRHQVIREGVVRAGRQSLLEVIFVDPQISTCGYGGVDPSHEFRSQLPTPLQVPSPDTFVSTHNLFRLKKEDGQPVRTVLTTGIAGIGMSVCVAKFCLDWAELRFNRDLYFVIKLSFQDFWFLQDSKAAPSKKMSIMEVIEHYYPELKGMKYLEEDDCKFLIIMDSFDCYQTHLDWENAPVINDNYTKAHLDVLLVNIIRGSVLRGARIWILGRRAAVLQIPSHFIDIVTEIQGFSDEMKDNYMNQRYETEQAERIMTHYKRVPGLKILARQPFVCWMMCTVFDRCYRYRGYGEHPPRLTPFYVSIVTVQTNRRLQAYYDKQDNELKWSNDDKNQLIKMGKMAFKMLERDVSVFFEGDLKEYGLKLTEVTVWSGLCTELPNVDGKRVFCFVHFTIQEFMAALYVFTMFRLESKNVLEAGGLHMPKMFMTKDHTKSAAGLVHCALERTLSAPLGHYDMFLRFLCGVLNPDCHDTMLSGYLFRHKSPKVGGLDEAQRLLEGTIQTAQERHRDRVENLKECLREMTQEDE
ncbi:protein NLRC3 [Symphorus nematophorus]